MRHRDPDQPGPPTQAVDASVPGDDPASAPEPSEVFDDGRPRSVRVRVGLGAAVVLLIGALVIAVVVSASAQQGASATITSAPHAVSQTDAPAAVETSTTSAALVHVLGAVQRPGLVELDPGARVVDAIAAAGGLTDDADPAAVNLARVVADGEQLYVARIGETPPVSDGQDGGAGAAAGGGAAGGNGAAAVGAKVALNTATQGQLETLPRIGPALAQRILDWRSANGRFSAVTDLLKVAGIGQKLFDGIKDRVTV